jgi:hypothetical protein
LQAAENFLKKFRSRPGLKRIKSAETREVDQQAVNLDQNQARTEAHAQPEQPSQPAGISMLFPVFLNSLSFAFFCISFSSLMRMLPSWCHRFVTEE